MHKIEILENSHKNFMFIACVQLGVLGSSDIDILNSFYFPSKFAETVIQTTDC